jgi:hypothetical protein
MINRHIQLEIIDAALFSEMAQPLNLQGVPTVMLGDDFRWTGATSLEEILEVLTSRDLSSFSASAIERMLEEGKALKIAGMMLEKDEIFPSLPDMLINDKFVVRLGAMAAMEEVTSQNIQLASEIVDPLWENFGQVIEPMQIDILYLLGDAGTKETIPLLESVVSGDHRDHVKEAAREAIDSIKERHAPV